MVLNGCHDEDIIDGGSIDNTDPNAPKVINSKEIKELNTYFYLDDYLNNNYTGFYEIDIKENNGEFILKESKTFKIEENICKEEVAKFQEIIDKYELVKANGYDKVTAGLPPEYQPMALSVKYVSNESLYFRENNNPDSEWTMQFVKCTKDIFISHGHEELKEPVKVISNFIVNFTNEGSRYHYFFLIDQNEELKLARSVIQNNVVIEDKIINVPENFNELIHELIDKCDLYSFNTGSLNVGSDLYKKEFYEIYIDFDDGSQIYDYSNEDEKVQKFNLIKEDILNALEELFK